MAKALTTAQSLLRQTVRLKALLENLLDLLQISPGVAVVAIMTQAPIVRVFVCVSIRIRVSHYCQEHIKLRLLYLGCEGS